MEKPRYIYALSDPETHEPRYVGATVNPAKRFSEHCSLRGRKGQSLREWIDELAVLGTRPVLVIIERVEDGNWQARETHWIQEFRERGCSLLNSNDGGDGPPSLDTERWARDYDACVKCGRTDRVHSSDGLCNSCYNNRRHRQLNQPDRPYHEWALDYPQCIECSTVERKHKGYGLCTRCFANRRTRIRRENPPALRAQWSLQHERCIDCGTTERRHAGHGLCSRCHARTQYRIKHGIAA